MPPRQDPEMSEPIYLEQGTRRVFACSLAWPGWCRVGRNEDAAIDALAAYAGRYAVVAEEAGGVLGHRVGVRERDRHQDDRAVARVVEREHQGIPCQIGNAGRTRRSVVENTTGLHQYCKRCAKEPCRSPGPLCATASNAQIARSTDASLIRP